MNKKEAIVLLIASLREIPSLKKLNYDNEQFPLWRNGVETIIKYGLDGDDYNTFESVQPVDFLDDIGIENLEQSVDYPKKLKGYETALKSIIQKYEILGFEEEPTANIEVKDTIKLPIQLFDAMQFHPKVVKASEDCFVAGNYREAILNAFISLIDYIKEITGLDLDGDDLMNQVFSFNYDKDLGKITKYPIIRLNKLKDISNRGEQQGFMFLYKGAAGAIRNPKAHKIIPQSNPLHTLEYLAFASLLMRTVEEGAVAKTSLPRTKWDWGRFLADTKSKCELGIVRLAVNLYEFTRSNSDFISWGTGNQDGSFTFRKLGLGGMISIFSMYSCGWIYINFGSLKNKNVPGNIMDSFRYNLNTIQTINIPKESVTNGKFARIYEKPLTNSKNLKLFQDAIISLCQQIE